MVNGEEITFKNDIDNNAYYTYNLHSFNKNLPYFQRLNWQRFQLPHVNI